MSKIIKDLKVFLDEDLQEKLQLLEPNFSTFRILRKSIDSRKRHAPHEVYTVEIFDQNEEPEPINFSLKKINWKGQKPIIVGAGPAGLFCALRLVEHGVPCILLERGNPTEKRIFSINRFWRYGEFDPNDNVCFGEGGAGFFSDGKLITRIKSEHIPYIMDRMVLFGAPEEVRYLANPHIGSDKIRRLIPKLRKFLIENGCEIYFNTIFQEFILDKNNVAGVKTMDGQDWYSHHVVLATGHSANDLFETLHKQKIKLEGKSTAIGLRIEHSQEFINKNQYGKFFNHPKLKAANYKLTCHDDRSGIGVYSFCMCPGGYVLSSGSDADGVVCNGMSNYNRNSPFANSGIVVTIDHKKIFGTDIFGGLHLRRTLEQLCYGAVQEAGGTKELPAQQTLDFIENKLCRVLPTSCPSGVVAVDFNKILPDFILKPLKKSLKEFDKKINGFIENSQLHGIESRTSCPIRIPRDPESLQSVSHGGLYPAVDGIKIAEKIIETN